MLAIKNITAKSKIFKNFSVLTLSNSLNQVLLIFTSVKIARSLDPVVFGTYNLLQLHMSIILIISAFGVKNIIIRSIARKREVLKKVFMIAIVIRSIGFLIAISLFCTYFLLYGNYDNMLFFFVLFGVVPNIFFDIFESVAFGLEKMEFSGIINFLSTLLWVITIVAMPKQYLNLHLIYGLFVLFTTLKTTVYFISLYRQGYLKDIKFEQIDKKQVLEFSKESFPYYYLALFTLLSNQIPLLFLQYRSGIAQIGYFNLASKILMPINLILTTILAAIFPTFSRLFVTDYKLFTKNLKLVFSLVCLFGIAGAFGVTFFRQEVIHLLYGSKYNNASLVLGYQCWYIAIYGGVCLIGTILGAVNRQKEMSYLSIVCTIIQVPILWVGSKYGAQYLSAAFLLATAINFCIHIYVIRLYLKDALPLFFYLKIFALYIIGYVVSLLIPENMSLSYKALLFSCIVFTGGYFMYRKNIVNIKKIMSNK